MDAPRAGEGKEMNAHGRRETNVKGGTREGEGETGRERETEREGETRERSV